MIFRSITTVPHLREVVEISKAILTSLLPPALPLSTLQILHRITEL